MPTPFAEAVLDLVEQIPEGRVAAYGDIAKLLGSGGARAVGTVMARFGSDVPWWRVVRSDGRPPQCHENLALEHYRSEGTPLVGSVLTGRRVDLARARWPG
ncbi:MAG: MGMT family protein [Nostocoides sp.]